MIFLEEWKPFAIKKHNRSISSTHCKALLIKKIQQITKRYIHRMQELITKYQHKRFGTQPTKKEIVCPQI